MEFRSKNSNLFISANGVDIPLKIKGINWFGFQKDLAPNGLWAQKMTDILDFVASNGFNALGSHFLLNLDLIKI